MITVSDNAKEYIHKMMKTEGKAEDSLVRVGVKGGGCSGLQYEMKFDTDVKQGDQVFEDKGIKLVTDIKSFLYLCDTTLEFTAGLNGKGFHFINPNASRTCACGESFAV